MSDQPRQHKRLSLSRITGWSLFGLLILYVLTYAVWSRTANRYWRQFETEGYYFTRLDGPLSEDIHLAAYSVFYPLHRLEKRTGSDCFPSHAIPMWNLN